MNKQVTISVPEFLVGDIIHYLQNKIDINRKQVEGIDCQIDALQKGRQDILLNVRHLKQFILCRKELQVRMLKLQLALEKIINHV